MYSVKSVIILITFLVFSGTTWAKDKNLSFGDLRAEEGSNNFSLSLSFRSPEGYYKPINFDIVSLYQQVSVEPAVEFTISAQRRGFSLQGNFRPQTSYKVKLKESIRSLEGYRLAKDVSKSIRTPDFSTRFVFTQGSAYVPARFQALLPWEAINAKEVEITVRRIYQQNLHHWITSGTVNDYTGDIVLEKTLDVSGQKNQVRKGVLSLAELKPLGKGAFHVNYKIKDKYLSGGSTVIVTGLSVIAKKTDKNELVAWVVDTDELSPLRGAEVHLYSRANRLMGSCSTSWGSGECKISWTDDKRNDPYSILVKKGDDQTYLRLSDFALKNDAFEAGTRSFTGEKGKFEAFVYSERNLYRPGEKVRLAAAIRNSQYVSIDGMTLKWFIKGPRGKTAKEAATTTNEFGVTTLDFATAGLSDTGNYKVELKSGQDIVGDYSFLVEEFVPERIKVSLTSPNKAYINQKATTVHVSADYLFGAPVKGGQWQSNCFLKPAFTAIPKHKEFKTGLFRSKNDAIQIDSSSGHLDANGKATTLCKYNHQLGIQPPQMYNAFTTVSVQEAGSGRASKSTIVSLVGGTDTLLGLKKIQVANNVAKIKGKLFSVEGQPQKAAGDYKVELFRVTRNWYYTHNNYGGRWKVEEVVEPTANPISVKAESGEFVTDIKIPKTWGQWLVRATDTKSGYMAELMLGYVGYYWNPVAHGGKIPEPHLLDLQVSKEEVSPGEDFSVTVVAPFKGRLLLSLENNGVISHQWKDIDRPGPQNFKLEAPSALPNFYVTGLLLKKPKDGKNYIPGRAFAAQAIRVIPKEHKLNVTIQHPEITPSRKTVEIRLGNSENTPVTYSVAIVDEGILQMTQYKTPDPLDRFFESRRMGVKTFETLGYTFTQVTTPGGDAPASLALSSGNKTNVMPVKLVSYWFGPLESDKSGNARVKIELPAFQGKLRVMALAHGKSRMGSQQSFLTVRDPIITQPTLPRFLITRDLLRVPVAITNMSGKNETVTVSLKANNLVNLRAKEKELQLNNGEQKVTEFIVAVRDQVGVANFSVESKGRNGFSYKEDFTIPVKPRGVEHTLYHSLDPSGATPLASLTPTDWDPESKKYVIKVTNQPYMAQLGRIKDLIRYPYGCIEQTTSSTMPLLAIRELIPFIAEGAPDIADRADEIESMIQSGIDRLLNMQTASGGFSYWPGSPEADPWGSAYATHLLIEAKKFGYQVPKSSLNEALNYLDDIVKRENYQPWVSAYGISSASPFAVYVLAKAGRKPTQPLRNMADSFAQHSRRAAFAQWEGITGENYFLLAAAAKLTGDKEALKSLDNKKIYSMEFAGDRDQEFTYWSPLRSDGLRLSVLEDIWPKSPAIENIAQRVANKLRQTKAYYFTTQEMAWGILGLGKRLKGYKRVSNDEIKKVKLSLNGKTLKPLGKKNAATIYQLADGSTGTLKAIGVKKNQGVWIYADVTGYTEKPPTSTGQVKVSRRYYKEDGSIADLGALKVGETYVVQLSVTKNTKQSIPNVAIVDRLPAGLEIENPRLGRSHPKNWFSDQFASEYIDMRDDRIQVFGNLPDGNTPQNIYYQVRAVTPGQFMAPPSFVEAMYEPSNFDYGTHDVVKVQ